MMRQSKKLFKDLLVITGQPCKLYTVEDSGKIHVFCFSPLLNMSIGYYSPKIF